MKTYIKKLEAEINPKEMTAQQRKELKVKLARLGGVERKLNSLLSEKEKLSKENDRLKNSIAEKKRLTMLIPSGDKPSLTSLTSLTRSQTFTSAVQGLRTEDSPRKSTRSPTLNDSLMSGGLTPKSPANRPMEPKSADKARKGSKSKTVTPNNNKMKNSKSVLQLTEIEEIMNAQDKEEDQEKAALLQEITYLKKDLAEAKQEIARLRVLLEEDGAVRPELQNVMEERDNLHNELVEKTQDIKKATERINELEKNYKIVVKEKESANALIDEELENIEKLASKLKEAEEQVSFVIAHAKATMLLSQNERANSGLDQRVKVLEEWQTKYGAIEKFSELTKDISQFDLGDVRKVN